MHVLPYKENTKTGNHDRKDEPCIGIDEFEFDGEYVQRNDVALKRHHQGGQYEEEEKILPGEAELSKNKASDKRRKST